MKFSMIKYVASICVLALLFSCSCSSKSTDDEPGKERRSNTAKANGDAVRGIRSNANYVLDQLVELESVRDVTCWTSFRQLDWYIAEKSYGEFATLAKVAAI
ncbi:MAG: hypothetical protein JKY56_02520, partial [Kofleriaceae bacterium]|nr:hypothetical protein [Kofleriaceae bacterium]